MIYLNEGTSGNTVVVTLNENTTLAGTSGVDIFYLFEFTKVDENTTKIFLAGSDTSTNKVRYNEYNIELVDSGSEDLLNGKVNLIGGRYKYNIYQQSSSTNLLIANTSGIVEKGFVQVNIPITQTTYNSQDNENIVYTG